MVQIGETIDFDKCDIPYINCISDAHKMFQSTHIGSKHVRRICDICGDDWDDQCYCLVLEGDLLSITWGCMECINSVCVILDQLGHAYTTVYLYEQNDIRIQWNTR